MLQGSTFVLNAHTEHVLPYYITELDRINSSFVSSCVLIIIDLI